MYRVSDMIGKTVVSVNSGEKLGTISDALLEPEGVGLIALVIGSGLLGKERVLPLTDIQTLGRDTVLARTDEHLMNAREWRESDVSATRSSAVKGRRVVTADGREIGHVSDFLVDETTGAFGGLEVESRSLAGLRTHRQMILASAAPKVGPDAIVVDQAALDASREHVAADEPRDRPD